MGLGGGGTDVRYEQSPEQRAVFQALLPMITRLGQQYAPTEPSITRFARPTPTVAPSEWGGFKKWEKYLPADWESRLPTATSMAPTAQPQPPAPMYEIPPMPQLPSPEIASPLAAYGMIAPQVQAGLWQPYQEAEERLMDVLQARGQLGAPGAGISGAAAAGLGEFYSQAARDIGLGTYQMALPFTQMAQAPLSQYWAAQTGMLGDVWRTQLQREMMPWQMLPGLLGGAYPTGIAEQETGLGAALGSGLMGAGLGAIAAPATGNLALAGPYGWAIPTIMGLGGLLTGGR